MTTDKQYTVQDPELAKMQLDSYRRQKKGLTLMLQVLPRVLV